jgi:hypothetical protein
MKNFASLLLLLASAWTGQASAQTYQCAGPSGMYVSSRPCPDAPPARPAGGAEAAKPKLYYGPAEEQPQQQPSRYYQPPVPTVSEAPSHLRYMSASCATMNDALRTAQSKGLKYETIQGMQNDYRKQCSEEEMNAMNKMSRDRYDAGREKRIANVEAQVSQVEEQGRNALKQQQCIEGRRILANKKARTDLTAGEKSDLVRFEENFRTRCG